MKYFIKMGTKTMKIVKMYEVTFYNKKEGRFGYCVLAENLQQALDYAAAIKAIGVEKGTEIQGVEFYRDVWVAEPQDKIGYSSQTEQKT
jgi:hypothetical protein